MSKQYCVLTIRNEVLNSTEKEFVPPTEKLSEVMDKYTDTYVITNIEYGNYEFFLNQKLDYAVRDYNNAYKYIQETLKKMLTRKCTMRVGIDTLNCAMTNIEVSERQIERLINRMIREDFNIDSEEAHIIYNLIMKQGRTI